MSQAHAAENNKGASPPAAPMRSLRSRTTAAAAAVAAAPGPESPSPSPNLKREEAGNAIEMRSRIAAMQDKFGSKLGFLATEFSKMEAQLSPEVGASKVGVRFSSASVSGLALP